MKDREDAASRIEVLLTPELAGKLAVAIERTGCEPDDLVEQALRQFLFWRSEGKQCLTSRRLSMPS